jgi:hypothetical protein
MERRQQFNPPARMTIHARDKHSQTCSGTHATDPSNGEHIWHTLRDAIKFNTSETHPGLDVKGACCVVVRNVDLWAPPPHPAAVDVRAAPPTVTTRAACVQQQRRQLRGVISEERLAKLHKMYGHGTARTQWKSKARMVSQRP